MVKQEGQPRLDEDYTPRGVSREAIRQQQKNSLRKLRRLMEQRGYKAEDFFDTTRKTNNVRYK